MTMLKQYRLYRSIWFNILLEIVFFFSKGSTETLLKKKTISSERFNSTYIQYTTG